MDARTPAEAAAEMIGEIRKIAHMLRAGRTRDRQRVTHAEGGELKTKQGLQDGTDINKIMDRWLKHGTSVAHMNPNAGSYGDFSSGLDYREALTSVKAAEADFAALPARVRAACGNDPGEFLQIVFDPERRDELEGMGLVGARAPGGASESDTGDSGADVAKSSPEPTSGGSSPPVGDGGEESPSPAGE